MTEHMQALTPWVLVAEGDGKSVHLRHDGTGQRTVSLSDRKAMDLINALRNFRTISIVGGFVFVAHWWNGFKTTTVIRLGAATDQIEQPRSRRSSRREQPAARQGCSGSGFGR